MNPADLNIDKLIPGALGAIGSWAFIRATRLYRSGMVLIGVALAHYGSPTAVKFTGLDAEICGFILGLLGMKVIETIVMSATAINFAGLLNEIIRKWAGLPTKEL